MKAQETLFNNQFKIPAVDFATAGRKLLILQLLTKDVDSESWISLKRT